MVEGEAGGQGAREAGSRANGRARLVFVLFCVFFKAGLFTFSGGLAMLPVISKDVAEKHGMMSEDRFLEYAALSQALPGVIAVNCAVFVGNAVAGVPGAVAAGFGAALPAFAAMLAVAALVTRVEVTGRAAGAFAGVRAASAAVIIYAMAKLGKGEFRKVSSLTVMACSFAAAAFFGAGAVPIMVAAVAAGAVAAFVKARMAKGGHGG